MLTALAQSEAAIELTTPELGLVIGLCLAGLGLLLLGRRLVKPVCVASGIVLGVAGATLAVSVWAELEAYQLVAVAVGAVLGGILSGLLFRIWVAGAGAVLLALAVPLASLAWQGSPLPLPTAEAAETPETEPATLGASGLVEGLVPEDLGIDLEPAVEEATEKVVEGAKETVAQVGHAIRESLADLFGHHRPAAEAWWRDLGEAGRRNVLLGAGLGALLGLLLGVSAPYTASSLLSAMAGALLLVFGGRTLALAFGGETALGWMPDGPRALTLTVGLITAVGLVLQWTLRPRKSD